MDRRRSDRESETRGLGDLVARERERILRDASPRRLEQMHRAESVRAIYTAWNAVCGRSREGRHVTGLRYLPDSNELLVYLDEPCWTQELTMLREIIRGRMQRVGVELDGFVFKTSRAGYHRPSRTAFAPPHLSAPTSRAGSRPDHCAPLSDAQIAAIECEVDPIEDEKLKEALKRAIISNLEWKKGSGGAE